MDKRPLPQQQSFGHWFRSLPHSTQIIFIGGALIIAISIGTSIVQSFALGTTNTAKTTTPQQVIEATSILTPPTPTLAPTPTPPSIHYPPATVDDLHGLATQGDASAIHEFHSESVGLVAACPQPKREVTVDPRVTGRQLAEDLLAYFYAQLLDNPCGSVVFAYHTQGEASDAYTAGRILLDVTDSSGAGNFDPNASNLKYTLTLDIGGAFTGNIGGSLTGQEYVVTY